MRNSTPQFREAMLAAGLEPPAFIELGLMHRFPGIDKVGNNTAGWCILFKDELGGSFGDWSNGLSEDWKISRDRPWTKDENEEFWRNVKKSRAEAEKIRTETQTAAATNANEILKNSIQAPETHPYLLKKQIKPHIARLYQGKLIIPLREGKEIFSIQFIAEDGSKKFLSGGRVSKCYNAIGSMQGYHVLCLAEGFSTGASVHESTNFPVIIAFNAGNMVNIAKEMRRRFPTTTIIICSDDDINTQGNPGLTSAKKAAEAIGGYLAVPDSGECRPDGATDFNDMAIHRGLEAVKTVINNAIPVNRTATENSANTPQPKEDWPEPQPLIKEVNTEPYPIDALPTLIRSAVEEVQRFVQAPMSLVASSALGTLSLATQANIDVIRTEKLAGPVSLYFLVIADSGERKSTCDGFFTQAIRDYDENQATAAKPLLKHHSAEMDGWEAKRNGIKDKIRQLAKDSKDTSAFETNLSLHEQGRPESPRVPRLIYGDATPEALSYGLAKKWPSGGIVSAEAGAIFDAQAMGKESIMRNLALLNTLCDGGSHAVDRKTGESFVVRGARFSIAVQVQEATLMSFLDQSGTLARGIGFLARFLIARPESTQGSRLFTEPPANWPALETFNKRLAEILAQPVPMNDEGSLTPPLLPLSPDAKEAWIAFHDTIEKELVSGGELYDVRDTASKAADNTVRLAALLHVFSGNVGGAIGLDAIESACRIVA